MHHFKDIFKILAILLIVDVKTNNANNVTILGLVPVNCEAEYYSNKIPVYYVGDTININIFGVNLHQIFDLGIAKDTECNFVEPSEIKVTPWPHGQRAMISLTAPEIEWSISSMVRFKFCVKERDGEHWTHQDEEDVSIYVKNPLITPLVAVFIVLFCLSISSLMSGLNIGLMVLSPEELEILKKSGTRNEKKYSNMILKVRTSGNYLLCSILITATLCNSLATVLIDEMVSNYLTVCITTITIVLFCEILPQAVCTYFPLLVGYYTICITYTCMILTAPISFPLGKLLNKILGDQIATSHTRERLKELIKMAQLPTHEEKIISGTLDMSRKRVEDIMTLIGDVFTLPITAIMDFETIASIQESGYSRIPIYVESKSNIRYVLLTKDLALLDPDDSVPVRVLVENSKFICSYLPVGTTLDNVLGLFKISREHMAFVVESSSTQNDLDDKRVIGIVTFEDVIEEILQAEINDETDTFVDNRSKIKIATMENNDVLTLLAKYTRRTTAPSANLKLATFYFLSGIEMFSMKYISPTVLLNMLSFDIYHSAPGNGTAKDIIYLSGEPKDYFIMILEGLMQVKLGSEELEFEAGPFKYFGLKALQTRKFRSSSEDVFKPDYSLQAIKETLYLKIEKSLYEASLLATKFEQLKEAPPSNIPAEVSKYYLQLVKEDIEDTRRISFV